MAINICRIIFFVTLVASTTIFAKSSLEQTQTLQIYTNFKNIVGKPTWLLIIRDVDTGLISPYLFEIKNHDNFWVAFTFGHHYKITVSTLQFEGCLEIKNFCRLENGIVSSKSIYMTLSGQLTPDPYTLKCNVMKYSDTAFTIVKK